MFGEGNNNIYWIDKKRRNKEGNEGSKEEEELIWGKKKNESVEKLRLMLNVDRTGKGICWYNCWCMYISGGKKGGGPKKLKFAGMGNEEGEMGERRGNEGHFKVDGRDAGDKLMSFLSMRRWWDE
jgi:hypothetical protein